MVVGEHIAQCCSAYHQGETSIWIGEIDLANVDVQLLPQWIKRRKETGTTDMNVEGTRYHYGVVQINNC